MKPGGTAELWELEDFPWLCFGGRVCVCVGVGRRGSSCGPPAPTFPGFCPLVAVSELQLQDEGRLGEVCVEGSS